MSRLKLLQTVIKNCEECHYCTYMGGTVFTCLAVGRNMTPKEHDHFPEWCPLDDQSEAD